MKKRNNLFVGVKTSRGKKISSTRWLQRQLNDDYVRQAQIDGYRSRAAYKLLQIEEKFGLLSKAEIVIDLGCAPGSWLQVANKLIKCKHKKIIGIDLLDIEPISEIDFVKGDFTALENQSKILELCNNKKPDLIMSDMASNSTGHKNTDHIRIMDLCEQALAFACANLSDGGSFICKILQGGTESQLLKYIKSNFSTFKHFKPNASRKDSKESYLVAKCFSKLEVPPKY